jgi:hypothetical protein
MKLLMENWRTYVADDPVDALIAAIRKVRKERPEDTESGGFTTWSGHFYTYLKAYKKMRGKNPQKAAKYLSKMVDDAPGYYKGKTHEEMIKDYIPHVLSHWHKLLKGEKKTITAYHGSNVPIRKFSRDHGAQGVMWFSEDKEKIIAGESGALSTKYIMKVELAVEKTTGWDDYDKKFLQQIENEGFDSIQLDDNWIVFDPSRVKVVGIEKR